jgi:hypothetical protein
VSLSADMREVWKRLAERHEIRAWDARLTKALLTVIYKSSTVKRSINKPYDADFVTQYGCKL